MRRPGTIVVLLLVMFCVGQAFAQTKTDAASAPPPRALSFGDDGESGAYTYDGSGNITAIGSDTFLYDAEGRLVRAVIRGVTENYTYDAFGNRTTATGATNCLGQTTCATTVTVETTTNHLTSAGAASVTYDAAGNITAASGGSYVYDGTGMMTRATVGSDDRQFVYTADDERIAARQGASWTWTVRGQENKVLREFTSAELANQSGLPTENRQWVKDYVWRDGLLLASTDANGTSHYHLDHLGTPRLITDANHVKVAEHAYYPFGAEISITPHESTEDAMKFTGHERDIVAGDGHTLDYMHARYFSSSSGRFFSLDPVFGSAGNPQSWNRYSYVLNNPVRLTDPTGRLVAQMIFVGGTAALVIITAYYVEAPSVAVPGKTNGQVLVSTAIDGFQAVVRAAGSLLPGREPTNLPPPLPASTPSRPSTPGTQATTGVKPAAPIQASGERNPAQDKLLTNGDIKTLQNAGHDIHELKGGENASKYDLYKDTAGNVYVKPKGGKGPGEETGINVKDLKP